MNTIVIAIVLVSVIGILAGILLSYASKIFAVKEDQLFIDLRNQCGRHGAEDLFCCLQRHQ